MPKRVDDPETVVKRAADVLRTLRGRVLTRAAARCLTELVCQEFPRLNPYDVGELLTVERVLDLVLTETVIEERARQIGILEITRQHLDLVDPEVEPRVAGFLAVDGAGRVLFTRKAGGAR